jgi:hypothetical protein
MVANTLVVRNGLRVVMRHRVQSIGECSAVSLTGTGEELPNAEALPRQRALAPLEVAFVNLCYPLVT